MASPHHSRLWRLLAAVLAGLMTLPLVAAIAFVIVLVVAGPHSGLLPEWMEMLVLAAGWGATIAAPLFAGRYVWRRLARNTQAPQA